MILQLFLTTEWLLRLRRLSGEEQAHWSASGKSFDYINGGRLRAFWQK